MTVLPTSFLAGALAVYVGAAKSGLAPDGGGLGAVLPIVAGAEAAMAREELAAKQLTGVCRPMLRGPPAGSDPALDRSRGGSVVKG